MDPIIASLIMGIVQGLTEFLPISSSGHLLLVPYLLNWHEPFIDSLAFSVALHGGTLAALLVYFREDWLRLIPAGLAAVRDRSFRGNPDRRLAWLLVASTIPGGIAGFLFSDAVEGAIRQPGLVAIMLVLAGIVLWLADRWSIRRHDTDNLTLRAAIGIGLAQAIALIPGVSRSGISISAGLAAGLDRASAARYSFLMAMPITAAAVAYEGYKLVRGDIGAIALGPLVVGVVTAFVAGIAAISVLLRYVRTRSFSVFVVYRFALAAIVLVAFLSR